MFNPLGDCCEWVVSHARPGTGLARISSIGYAVNEDDLNWKKLRRTVLESADLRESLGVEVPWASYWLEEEKLGL